MTISARKDANGGYVLANGHARLKAILSVHGKAEITDIATGESLYVHEVNGKLVVLSEDAQASVDDLVVAAINRARS